MSDPAPATMYQLADQFIALANDLARQHGIESTSAGLRYAAARYNAFEASLKGEDLAAIKQQALDWFGADYLRMLEENLDDHIQRAADQPGASL